MWKSDVALKVFSILQNQTIQRHRSRHQTHADVPHQLNKQQQQQTSELIIRTWSVYRGDPCGRGSGGGVRVSEALISSFVWVRERVCCLETEGETQEEEVGTAEGHMVSVHPHALETSEQLWTLSSAFTQV